MANNLIDKARARMDSLLREAQELKEWIERAERLDKDQTPPPKLNGHRKAVTKAKLGPRKVGPNPILDKVEEIMRKEGRPLSPQELTDRLGMSGIKVPGLRPAANLSAKLCTAKNRFKRVGYGQWVVAG